MLYVTTGSKSSLLGFIVLSEHQHCLCIVAVNCCNASLLARTRMHQCCLHPIIFMFAMKTWCLPHNTILSFEFLCW